MERLIGKRRSRITESSSPVSLCLRVSVVQILDYPALHYGGTPRTSGANHWGFCHHNPPFPTELTNLRSHNLLFCRELRNMKSRRLRTNPKW